GGQFLKDPHLSGGFFIVSNGLWALGILEYVLHFHFIGKGRLHFLEDFGGLSIFVIEIIGVRQAFQKVGGHISLVQNFFIDIDCRAKRILIIANIRTLHGLGLPFGNGILGGQGDDES